MATEIQRIVIDVLAFIIVSYFLFYKNYVKELGKKIAELTTIADKTQIVETVRKQFNDDLERVKGEIQVNVAATVKPLEALLQKENITHQIFTSEYIKLRFERLDILYAKVYELKKFCETQFFLFTNETEFTDKRESFYKCYDEVQDAFYRAAIYTDDNVQASVVDFLNESFKAMKSFSRVIETNKSMYNQTREELRIKMSNINSQAALNLDTAISKLPELLRNIEFEFKKHLTLPA